MTMATDTPPPRPFGLNLVVELLKKRVLSKWNHDVLPLNDIRCPTVALPHANSNSRVMKRVRVWIGS